MASDTSTATSIISRLALAALVIAFMMFDGWNAVSHYLRRYFPTPQLVKMHYRGDWALQEYRDCDSVNMKGMEPELECPESTDTGRMFEVNFDEPAYDNGKADGTVFMWRCRRTGSNPAFSCELLKTVENKSVSKPESKEEAPPPKPVINDDALPETIRSCIARFPNPYEGPDYVTYHNDLKADCERDPQRTTP